MGRTFSQGPGTVRAVLAGPGTSLKQRQATENDAKMTKTIEIIQHGSICLETI